jgi:rhamnosyltransferase
MNISIVKKKICGVVVLFNPEISVIDNIKSYIDQVDKLYAIDNSYVVSTELIEKIGALPKIEYLWNKTNIGIAAALNVGAKRAIQDGFTYLLTMDQDSEAMPFMVSDLLECFQADERIAIVAPFIHHLNYKTVDLKINLQCEQVFTVWTSGNLVKLDIFELVGGYREDFFIDYVDHEFCLRINKMGFQIFLCYKTILKHSLGKIEEVDLFFRKAYPTNHSALRLYYRTRNRFLVKKMYKDTFPLFFKQDNKAFWKSFVKAILFEKNKYSKLKMTLLGYMDFKRNNFGKYSD